MNHALQFQVNAVWVSLGTYIGITIVLALLFSLFRPRNSVVYAPKVKHADEKHAPPPIGKGLFAWLKPVLKTNESDLAETIGLDAIVFLRFVRMCRNLFLVLSVIGCLVMIPINISESDEGMTKGLSAFSTMTPMYVFSQALWSHVACAWGFDAIVAYFLWRNYKAVASLRRRYFRSPDYQRSLHARTLMVSFDFFRFLFNIYIGIVGMIILTRDLDNGYPFVIPQRWRLATPD